MMMTMTIQIAMIIICAIRLQPTDWDNCELHLTACTDSSTDRYGGDDACRDLCTDGHRNAIFYALLHQGEEYGDYDDHDEYDDIDDECDDGDNDFGDAETCSLLNIHFNVEDYKKHKICTAIDDALMHRLALHLFCTICSNASTITHH